MNELESNRNLAWEMFFSSRMNFYYHRDFSNLLRNVNIFISIILFLLILISIKVNIIFILTGCIFCGYFYIERRIIIHNNLSRNYSEHTKDFERIFYSEEFSKLDLTIRDYRETEAIEAKQEGKANKRLLNKAYDRVLREASNLYY
jgi:hypothetical protein